MSICARRHYEFAAEMLRNVRPERKDYDNEAYQQWETTVARFAIEFADDNKRFDRDRFWKACLEQKPTNCLRP